MLLAATDAAEIDGIDADGLSALGWAATLGHAPVCEALLAAGADRAALGDELEGELDALLAEAEAERRAEAEAAAAAAVPPIDYSSQGRLLLGEIAKYELPPPKEAPALPAALLLIRVAGARSLEDAARRVARARWHGRRRRRRSGRRLRACVAERLAGELWPLRRHEGAGVCSARRADAREF